MTNLCPLSSLPRCASACIDTTVFPRSMFIRNHDFNLADFTSQLYWLVISFSVDPLAELGGTRVT